MYNQNKIKMMKRIYDFEPKPVETIISTGMMTTTLRLDITKKEDGTYECEEVEYNHKEPLTKDKDYGPMVSTLIRVHYSQDRVEAITQGYLADPEGHKGDFDNLQSWRSEAKRIAKALFGNAQ
jgi:hypothetical protein